MSVAMYLAATDDATVDVLSWQSVNGKGYFAADVKLRLPDQRRFEPDLILRHAGVLWLIEVKGRHSEAIEDERKLAELLSALGTRAILRQVGARAGHDVSECALTLAVAYYGDDVVAIADEGTVEAELGPCVPGIVHMDWDVLEPQVAEEGLGRTIESLS